MTRFDIINKLIQENKFKTYLEIGTQLSIGGHEVNIKSKTGVDPAPMEIKEGDYDVFYQMTSDEFFAQNKKKFDIIFIDGDHSYKQSRKDFINAMQCLTKKGLIVMHDCLPKSEEYTSMLWNGEVFRTIADIHDSKLKYEIFSDDHGCAVIQRIDKVMLLWENESMTYEEYLIAKQKWNIND